MEYPPPQDLTIEVVPGTRPDVKIIRLRGPLTIHNFVNFQEMTRQEPFPGVMIVDLKDVPYIDSSALGTFVGIHVSCEGNSRKYALAAANERLTGLFEMSHVTEFLVIYKSVDEAQARLA